MLQLGSPSLFLADIKMAVLSSNILKTIPTIFFHYPSPSLVLRKAAGYAFGLCTEPVELVIYFGDCISAVFILATVPSPPPLTPLCTGSHTPFLTIGCYTCVCLCACVCTQCETTSSSFKERFLKKVVCRGVVAEQSSHGGGGREGGERNKDQGKARKGVC